MGINSAPMELFVVASLPVVLTSLFRGHVGWNKTCIATGPSSAERTSGGALEEPAELSPTALHLNGGSLQEGSAEAHGVRMQNERPVKNTANQNKH